MKRAAYRSPAVRANVYRSDLPKVVTVHDNRFVAPGLLEVLAGRAEVVADSAYGAAALRLADLITPDVVVAGELLGDGLIDHFLPDLVRVGARVLLLADELHPDRVLELVGRGLSGVCTTDLGLAAVGDAVLDVAGGGVCLPPLLMAAVVTQWRSGWRGGSLGRGQRAHAPRDGGPQRHGGRPLHEGRRSPARGGRQNGRKPQDQGVRQAGCP